MAVRGYPGWFTISRVLAFLALICVFLSVVVPGTPEWLLALAVALEAIALLVG